MTVVPVGVKVHLALGYTDMRKGMDGLAALVQEQLKKDPFSGHLFAALAELPNPASSAWRALVCVLRPLQLPRKRLTSHPQLKGRLTACDSAQVVSYVRCQGVRARSSAACGAIAVGKNRSELRRAGGGARDDG